MKGLVELFVLAANAMSQLEGFFEVGECLGKATESRSPFRSFRQQTREQIPTNPEIAGIAARQRAKYLDRTARPFLCGSAITTLIKNLAYY
jgi:hypothetical protein